MNPNRNKFEKLINDMITKEQVDLLREGIEKEIEDPTPQHKKQNGKWVKGE